MHMSMRMLSYLNSVVEVQLRCDLTIVVLVVVG